MTTQTPTGFGLRQPSGALSSRPAEVMPVAKSRSDREVKLSKTLPDISPLLLNWFTWYSRRYLRRHFHSLRVSLNGLPPSYAQLPLVIYSNHAAWWDALVGLVIKAEFFSGRVAFGPIDSKALENYKMFGRLGFFGVEQGTRRGAVQFLRTSEHILRDPNSLLVVTPQGRFADVRERPVRFAAGLGHLAMRAEHALFLPMATEFVFWEERVPEILVRFGEPVKVSAQHAVAFDAKYWTTLFEGKMEATQDALAAEAKRRDPDEFRIVLRGGAGQGGVYDWWRTAKAKMRGETFRKEHGTK
jgi:1-acyl-sn-glycerol-3-phosphate acyltransferase